MALAKFKEDIDDRYQEFCRDARTTDDLNLAAHDQGNTKDSVAAMADAVRDVVARYGNHFNWLKAQFEELMKVLDEYTDPGLDLLENDKLLTKENHDLIEKLSILGQTEETLRRLEKENEGLRNDNKGLRKALTLDDPAYEKMVENHMRTGRIDKNKPGRDRRS